MIIIIIIIITKKRQVGDCLLKMYHRWMLSLKASRVAWEEAMPSRYPECRAEILKVHHHHVHLHQLHSILTTLKRQHALYELFMALHSQLCSCAVNGARIKDTWTKSTGTKYTQTKYTGQNISGQNIPDKIYRTKGTGTKLTGQYIPDKIYDRKCIRHILI